MGRRTLTRRRTPEDTCRLIDTLARTGGLNGRDIEAFTAAYEAALGSDYDTIKVGAVIMYRGRIVGTGCNMLRSDPHQHEYNRFRTFSYNSPSTPVNADSVHAEIAAIKSVPYTVAHSMRWHQARIYVYRVAPGLPLGQGMARPCDACMEAIRRLGIRHIAYTTSDGFVREDMPSG